MRRNPATGEAIQIASSKKIAFRPAKELKQRAFRVCRSDRRRTLMAMR